MKSIIEPYHRTNRLYHVYSILSTVISIPDSVIEHRRFVEAQWKQFQHSVASSDPSISSHASLKRRKPLRAGDDSSSAIFVDNDANPSQDTQVLLSPLKPPPSKKIKINDGKLPRSAATRANKQARKSKKKIKKQKASSDLK